MYVEKIGDTVPSMTDSLNKIKKNIFFVFIETDGYDFDALF
jgi:hypothetical protein